MEYDLWCIVCGKKAGINFVIRARRYIGRWGILGRDGVGAWRFGGDICRLAGRSETTRHLEKTTRHLEKTTKHLEKIRKDLEKTTRYRVNKQVQYYE